MDRLARLMPYLAGIFVSIIFGFSFLFTKSSLDLMNPLQLLAYRFTVASLLLTILSLVGVINLNFKGKKILPLFLLSLFQPVVYFLFETAGVKHTTTSQAGIMIALIPVVVTVFSGVFLKERALPIQVIFIMLSVAGVILTVLGKGNLNMGSDYFGMTSLIGAVLSAAVYNILSRKLSQEYTPIEITFVMMWTGALLFNLMAAGQMSLEGNITNYFMPLLSVKSWAPVLYLGVLSSVAAFFMMNFMLSKLPAAQSSVFSNLTTVVSILAGVAIRGESFNWIQGLGALLILSGVWGTNYYRNKAAVLDVRIN